MEKLKPNINSIGLLWLRLLAGTGIAYHGYGKVFGGDIAGFAEHVAGMGFPFPLVFAWGAALAEFLGGVFIVLGLVTHAAAAAVFVTMGVAAFIAHAQDPLKVKELALAYWAMSGTLILTGAGYFSLDAAMRPKRRRS